VWHPDESVFPGWAEAVEVRDMAKITKKIIARKILFIYSRQYTTLSRKFKKGKKLIVFTVAMEDVSES